MYHVGMNLRILLRALRHKKLESKGKGCKIFAVISWKLFGPIIQSPETRQQGKEERAKVGQE